MEAECIFCKIANHEMPTELIFENDKVVVFNDIRPHAPVHVLIVPKKHIRSINDIENDDREIIAEMVCVAKDMAKKLSVNESGYRLLFNVEQGGGQVIFHIHMHLFAGWEKKNECSTPGQIGRVIFKN